METFSQATNMFEKKDYKLIATNSEQGSSCPYCCADNNNTLCRELRRQFGPCWLKIRSDHPVDAYFIKVKLPTS